MSLPHIHDATNSGWFWRRGDALLPTGLHRDLAVAWDDAGVIQAIVPAADAPLALPPAAGLLVPGLVNVHCHLELSHLHGRIPPGIGMVPFIQAVQRLRDQATVEERQAAIRKALLVAAATGTAAVGDIANSPFVASATGNLEQSVQIQTFFELYGGASAQAAARHAQAMAQLPEFPPHTVLTPHAPYSVSQPLLQLLHDSPRWSVHLLESQAELDLFAHRTGPFADWFAQIGLPFDSPAHDPWEHLQTALAPTGLATPLLLIHLTEATEAHLAAIRAQGEQQPIYLGLCPRSNLFLHHRLPNLSLFDLHRDRVCFGTDSLASNWSLDLVRELYVAQQYQPAWSTADLLTCATAHGADALGFSHLGRLQVGAAPGLVVVHELDAAGRFTAASHAIRLV